jgi:hypothetical protein
MAGFSVARAYSAGIDLIERKPWTLVWWAAAILVLQIIPRLLLGPELQTGEEASAVRGLMGAAATDTRALSASLERLRGAASHGGWAPWAWKAWIFFTTAVLYNAAFRAVLQPQSSAFGYLRVGLAEFWQTLVLIVFWAISSIYVLIAFGVAILGLGVAVMAGAGAPLTVAIVFLAVFALSYWLFIRLSMGFVITYAQSKFGLFASWKLTKGKAWSLFWTGMLSFATFIGLYGLMTMAVGAVTLPLLRGAGPTVSGPAMVALSQGPPPTTYDLMSVETLVFLLKVAAESLITAVVLALLLTPLAVAYKGLSEQAGGDAA